MADGEELWLCWEISATSGSPVALAIDNVRVSDFAGANPRIIQQPLSAAVKKTNDTYFQVETVGSGPLSYQWRRNGVDIAGATSARYPITSASSTLNGSAYSCLVSNAYGSALTKPRRV